MLRVTFVVGVICVVGFSSILDILAIGYYMESFISRNNGHNNNSTLSHPSQLLTYKSDDVGD